MTRDEVAAQLAAELLRTAAGAVAARGRFCCAVPGGSVARAVLPRLADAPFDWRPVYVFLADERFVPPDAADSNERLVRDLWLARTTGPGPTLHPLYRNGSLADAAAAAARDLTRALGDPPRLDLVLLGVGPDGHVASLFPGDAALDDPRWVVPVTGAPKPPAERLSLGLRTLAAARDVWLAAFGREKAHAIADARSNPASTLPAAIVAARAADVRWWLDTGAGG